MTHADALRKRGPGVPCRPCVGPLSYVGSDLFLVEIDGDDTPATRHRDVMVCLACGDRLVFAGAYLIAVDRGNRLAAEGPPDSPRLLA